MSIERRDDQQPFDEAMDRAWRSASDEQPSLRVDAAILAAARKPRSRFASWQPLAAAAAVAGLAFLLVQLMPRERAVEQPMRMEPAASSAERIESPATAPAQAPSQAGIEAASPRPAQRAPQASATQDLATPPPAPAPAESEPVAKAAAAPAAPAPLAAPSPALANEARAAGSAARDAAPGPQQWAAQIKSLHAAGDLEGAANQLRAFRSAYADADGYLSEEIRAWASSVK